MPTTNPVPSTDPSDLLFNAAKLDEVVSGASQYYTDRLGVSRRTMAGIDAEATSMMNAIDASSVSQLTRIQIAADAVLGGIGYAPPVAYAAGISLTLQTQTVSYNGVVYAPKVGNLPFTTSGTFETEKFRLIQGLTDESLMAPDTASKIGLGATTVAKKLMETVSIQVYGGVDDWTPSGGTNNAVALALLTADYPNGCIIKFPKTSTGVYDFNSYGAGNLNKYTYDVDEGVLLRFPNNAFMGMTLAKFVNDTTLLFKDMNTYYVMKSSYSNTLSHRFHKYKSQFLSQGDRDTTLVSAVDLSDQKIEKFDCAWPNGPFTASSSITTTSRKADIALSANNAGFKFIAVPFVSGYEYSFWFDAPAGWDGFYYFGVSTQNGYDVLYEPYSASGGSSRMVKEFGSDYLASSVPFLGSELHKSTWVQNSICTVRCLSHNSFVVLVNGVERYRSRATASSISSVIIGAGFGTSDATVSVRDVVVLKHKEIAGQKPVKILTIGDSITDGAIHGNWPSYMCEALEGTMGLRVRELRNIAVSGANSGHQYDSLMTAQIADIDIACILIGVNDIQGQTDPDAYYAYNIGRILDRLNSFGIPCVVGVPTQFYSRELGSSVTGFSNQGQDSLNYEKGKGYRGRLLYEVATRNPQLNRICYGTLEELGPVLSTYLNDIDGLDTIMSDNIHPTSHARRLIGYAMARSVSGMLAPKIIKSYPATRFNASWFVNGWTDTRDSAGFEISESGCVKFYGLLDKNSAPIANGTEVLRLPPFLRPSKPIRIATIAENGFGGFAGAMMVLIDSTSGGVYIFGAPAETAGVYLDNLQYQLDW